MKNEFVVKIESDPKEFLSKNESYLLKEESWNNLMLGLVGAIAQGSREATQLFMLSVYKNNEIAGHALKTDFNTPLSITGMESGALDSLVKKVYELDINLDPGVVGPKTAADYFVSKWQELTGRQAVVSMNQGVYELDAVIMPAGELGKLVAINENLHEVGKSFFMGFLQSCFPEESHSDEMIRKRMELYIRNESMFFLENAEGEIVSMACNSRNTKNTATISFVYTPPKYRGRGYGSTIVALLSQKLLSSGKQKCNLYTDLANPTSNSIYQKVGYKFLGESIHYKFKY